MGQFTQSIENSLTDVPVHLQSPVQSVARDGEDWCLRFGDSRPDVFARRVLIASPPGPTATMVTDWDPGLATLLSGIPSASAAIICLGVHQSQIARPLNAFGFVVPPRENRRILAGSFASHKFAGRAPRDHVLVRCFVGGTLQPEVLENSDSELIQIVRDELAEMIGLGGPPDLCRVIRWPNAMPQYNVGHLALVEQIRRGFDAHENLHWTCNAAGGVGISPTIASAQRVCEKVFGGSEP